MSTHHNGSLELLLVDDSDDDILMIREVLTEATQLNLKVVKDGEEAMAYVRREGKYRDARPPRLVLLDLRMPKKDGFAVLKEIKADPLLRHLPIVVLTTSSREEDVVRSYAAGTAAYITKPVGVTEWQQMARQFVAYWTQVVRLPAGAG